MRIIGGKYQRHQIHPPGGFKARPTTDIAKEALFNILENQFIIEEIEVLDLFSGSGNISYEFASRNCQLIWAVENNPLHISFIRKTCEALKMNQVKIFKADVFTFLKHPRHSFDLIFADPPFSHERIDELPGLVFSNQWLKNNGILIIEHDKNTVFSQNGHFFEERRYGHVHFSFFK